MSSGKWKNPMPLMERFFARVEKTKDCWLWRGSKTRGYGHISVDGVNHRAHRIAWMLLRGEIPHGLVLDHICRVRHCVNPDHLELVTPKMNVLRGISPLANMARRKKCKQGHDDWSRIKDGHRACGTCLAQRTINSSANRKAVLLATAATIDSFESFMLGDKNEFLKAIAKLRKLMGRPLIACALTPKTLRTEVAPSETSTLRPKSAGKSACLPSASDSALPAPEAPHGEHGIPSHGNVAPRDNQTESGKPCGGIKNGLRCSPCVADKRTCQPEMEKSKDGDYAEFSKSRGLPGKMKPIPDAKLPEPAKPCGTCGDSGTYFPDPMTDEPANCRDCRSAKSTEGAEGEGI